MSLTFSIVVNTYNRCATLRNTLRSFEYLRYRQFEVIVVNGPSTDKTADLLSEYAERIKIRDCAETNLSMSRNIGIAAASGDVVVFIDDDAYPEPDWLNRLASGYRDPSVGCVGGFIRDHTGVSFQAKATICNGLGESQNLETVDEAVKIAGSGDWFLSPTGVNVSYRRSALLEVGGFDEEFVYFLDETDVNYRIHKAGFVNTFVPDAEIHHKYAPSHLRRADKVPHSIYYPTRSTAYFCARNGIEHHGLGDIFSHLRKYAVSLKQDKRWYVENDVITRDHYERLLNEIDQGVRDGLRDALKTNQRVLLSQADLEESEFKAFVPAWRSASGLRICFLTREYPPGGVGGIAKWTKSAADSLARLGNEVTVITLTTEHPTIDFDDGVWVHRIRLKQQPQRRKPALPDIPPPIKDHSYANYDEVRRVHLRRGLDVVSAPIWELEGLATGNSGLLPTAVSLHTTFKLALPTKPEWLEDDAYRVNHVQKIIAAEADLLKTAPFLLANSDQIVTDLESAHSFQISPERVTVVPHGLSVLSEQITSEPKNGGLNVLFVGRFESRKGIDVLLAAIPRIAASNPDTTFTLVGDDSISESGVVYRKEFERKHAAEPFFDRVEFKGLVDEDTLERAYADCDIFVAPSRYESFGLIFIEAMRYSKPCVGTKIGGIQEIIEDSRSGVLCEPGDVDSLVQAVGHLLNDQEFREGVAEEAYHRFTKEFTSEVMGRRLQDFFRHMVLEERGEVFGT